MSLPLPSLLFLIAVIWCGSPLLAQDTLINYTLIDAHARGANKDLTQDLPQLVDYLKQESYNELETARSLFVWVAHFLSFDQQAYRKGNQRLNKNISDILRRRKAVCFGYAQLYQRLCQEAGIICEVVSGYSKEQLGLPIELDHPNHAWNAVRLEGKWYLLDVTWYSNLLGGQNRFTQQYGDRYFLSPPDLFLLQHFPSDPMWQLVDAPISFSQFNQDRYSKDHLFPAQEKVNFNFTDSIHQWRQLSRTAQRLQSAQRNYRGYPTEANAQELTACYMDCEVELSRKAEQLQESEQFDSLAIVQEQILELCAAAQQIGHLFSGQIENCAYTKINYASTLSALIAHASDAEEERTASRLELMIRYLEEAQVALQELPSNLFIEQALDQCKNYLAYAREQLAYYR